MKYTEKNTERAGEMLKTFEEHSMATCKKCHELKHNYNEDFKTIAEFFGMTTNQVNTAINAWQTHLEIKK